MLHISNRPSPEHSRESSHPYRNRAWVRHRCGDGELPKRSLEHIQFPFLERCEERVMNVASIINYNAGSFLREAIDSALNQTSSSLEMILAEFRCVHRGDAVVLFDVLER